MPLVGKTSPLSSSYQWQIERNPKEQGAYEVDLKANRRRLLALKGWTLQQINEEEPEYDDDVVVRKTGKTLEHTFDELGLHRVTMASNAAAAAATSAPQTVEFFVRYVRRELHSIDDEDRAKLFAAWKVLLDTPDDEGQATYGPDFRSHGTVTDQ